jgi:hypothetical protein
MLRIPFTDAGTGSVSQACEPLLANARGARSASGERVAITARYVS